MRPITDFLPDVRLIAPGVPDFIAVHALTTALQQFLYVSEAWREWGVAREVGDMASGLASWANYTDTTTSKATRIKRIDLLRWSVDGSEVMFKTPAQLQEIDPLWRTREGSTPLYWTTESEKAASGADVSQYQIRLYPMMASTVTSTYSVLPRFIVITDVVSDTGLDAADTAVPSIPDRIFYGHRSAIVGTACAYLLGMPGKDWSDARGAQVYAAQAAAATMMAKSQADAEYGHPVYVTTYGGL